MNRGEFTWEATTTNTDRFTVWLVILGNGCNRGKIQVCRDSPPIKNQDSSALMSNFDGQSRLDGNFDSEVASVNNIVGGTTWKRSWTEVNHGRRRGKALEINIGLAYVGITSRPDMERKSRL